MGEELKEKLFYQKENGWNNMDEIKKKEIFTLSNAYMDFLNKAKTEREFIQQAKILADNNGYRDIMKEETLNPGDKIYLINREKSMY